MDEWRVQFKRYDVILSENAAPAMRNPTHPFAAAAVGTQGSFAAPDHPSPQEQALRWCCGSGHFTSRDRHRL